MKNKSSWKKLIPHLLITMNLTGAVILGCSTVNEDAVRLKIGNAETAVSQASATDAQEHAPLEAKMAKNKLDQAKTALEKENYLDAKYLAEEAIADARLAEAKAESAKTEDMVQTLKKSIGDLRNEIERQ